MPRQIQGSQFDFSYGEVDTDLKRNDSHPARKGGLRQMLNARIHNSGIIQNRSGRSALFPTTTSTRIEELTMSSGNDFKLAFEALGLRVFNAAGTQVAAFIGVLPWAAADTDLIRYAVIGFQIFLTFPGMRPQVVLWDGGAGWTIGPYNELLIGNQKRTPFYRISPQGITLVPSAQTGAITLTASAPLFSAAWIGSRIRFVNRQCLITGFVNNQQVNATVQEALPGGQTVNFLTAADVVFNIGDVVIGSVTGTKGIVTGFSGVGNVNIEVQLVSAQTTTSTVSAFRDTKPGGNATAVAFLTTDYVAGPGGSLGTNAVSVVTAPKATTFWDDEVMNDFRGYPASCFADQFRLGFCDFPSVPRAIAWSTINSSTDIYPGSNPNEGMFEPMPGKVRVYDVVPGPEGSEFIFTDKQVSYIPISETNPLKPGSVAFKTLSADGAAHVRPQLAQEAIIYINAGGNSPMAIIATGAFLRPFNTQNLSDHHSHLFNNIQCIACPGADEAFNERYVYVLNGDGTVAVGRYKAESLPGNEPVIGWGPWSGAGTVGWIHAWGADVLFTTSYSGVTICEQLNDDVYMDASLFVNALPASFTPPVGKGPLWTFRSTSVFLMDQVTRPMGVYQVDANGFIVPQNNGGENLAAATLVAGQIWSGAAEPFAPDAPSGADQHQRMNERSYSYFAVYVIHSTGLTFNNIFSGKQTRLGPVVGSVTNTSRRPAYNMDDDTSLPPVQRDTVEKWTPPGASFDPRCAVVWDTPGPIQILEFAMEVST